MMMQTEIAAAHRAVAEGLAIIEAAREVYGITGRKRAGPLTRQFQPAEPPEFEGPDYFLTDREQDEARAARVMLQLARLLGSRGKAYQRAAGGHLEALRKHRDREQWLGIVHYETGLRPARAYALMALAKDKKTVDQDRARARERQRKKRAKTRRAKVSQK